MFNSPPFSNDGDSTVDEAKNYNFRICVDINQVWLFTPDMSQAEKIPPPPYTLLLALGARRGWMTCMRMPGRNMEEADVMLVKYIMLFVLMAIRPFSFGLNNIAAMVFINIASSIFCSSFSSVIQEFAIRCI